MIGIPAFWPDVSFGEILMKLSPALCKLYAIALGALSLVELLLLKIVIEVIVDLRRSPPGTYTALSSFYVLSLVLIVMIFGSVCGIFILWKRSKSR